MKDRRLLVPVRCTTRKFYLQHVKGRNDFHVRFTVPAHLQQAAGCQVVFRNLGTNVSGPAKERAREVIESIYSKNGAAADGLKLRNGISTIGELLAIYGRRAEERPLTVGNNARALRLIIREIQGVEVPDGLRCDVLTGDLVRKFEAKRLAGITERRDRERVRATIRSYLTQARSVVALDKMKFYSELTLADLTSFRTEKVKGPARRKPQPLDMQAITAMNAAAPQLATDDPAAYVSHLLFSRLGLRNIEQLHARWTWIADGCIGIVERPDENFYPKGNEGYVPIAVDVLAELQRFRRLSTNGYLVPGIHLTERRDAIYRRHSKWAGKWIKDRSKTSYELRRYAGSRIFDLGGSIMDVRDFLRHASVQTTEQWYFYRMNNRQLPTIGMKNLVPQDS